MAYDEDLAGRLRDTLKRRRGVKEKKMFGGLAFMVHGNMCVGIVGEDLMVRVGPDATADALKRKHARPMDFTGKPLKGMVYVGPKGIRREQDLRSWVELGLKFAKTLPKK
jgi:TfoX/Sxy family transcriptional regulator of competence genes